MKCFKVVKKLKDKKQEFINNIKKKPIFPNNIDLNVQDYKLLQFKEKTKSQD